MEKIYVYENAVVMIVIPEDQSQLKRATEDFLKNVIKYKKEQSK